MKSPLEQLRRFAILADLTDDELEVLARHATSVSLSRGDYLFREGDPGDALYLLEEGVLVVERVLDEQAGRAKDLAILPAISLVGEMALADAAPRSASVRAEIPCSAQRISRESFEKVMSESPAVASKVFRALFAETSQRLRDTNEELVAVYEVGRFVAGASDLPKVAESVLRSLAGRLGAGYALVALYSAEKNALEVVRAFGAHSAGRGGTLISLSDGGLAARSFDEKRPLLVERLLGATDAWESQSMILAPLVVRDQSVGLLILGEPESGGCYRVSQLSLASAVSNISAPLLLDAFAPR